MIPHHLCILPDTVTTRRQNAALIQNLALLALDVVYDHPSTTLKSKITLLFTSKQVKNDVERNNIALCLVVEQNPTRLLMHSAFDAYVKARVSRSRCMVSELAQVLDETKPKVCSEYACDAITRSIYSTDTKPATVIQDLLTNSRCYHEIATYATHYKTMCERLNMPITSINSVDSVANIDFTEVFAVDQSTLASDAFLHAISNIMINKTTLVLPFLLAYCRVVPRFIRTYLVHKQYDKEVISAVMQPIRKLRLATDQSQRFTHSLVASTLNVFETCSDAVTQPDIDWLAQSMTPPERYSFMVYSFDKLFNGRFLARQDLCLDTLLQTLSRIVIHNASDTMPQSNLLKHSSIKIIAKTNLLNTHAHLVNQLVCTAVETTCSTCFCARRLCSLLATQAHS